jgi:hypothetical protein
MLFRQKRVVASHIYFAGSKSKSRWLRISALPGAPPPSSRNLTESGSFAVATIARMHRSRAPSNMLSRNSSRDCLAGAPVATGVWVEEGTVWAAFICCQGQTDAETTSRQETTVIFIMPAILTPHRTKHARRHTYELPRTPRRLYLLA